MISIKRHIVLMKGAVAGLALGATSLDVARAADAALPLKAPRAAPVFDWSGLYVGGHAGYGGGTFGPGTNPLPQQGIFFPHSITGLIGGYQAGYNLQLANKWVLGFEADISFTSPLDRPKLVPAPFHTTFDYFGTARGRIGYAFGTWLPYVTGGAAWGRTRIDLNDADGEVVGNKSRMHLGWVAGAGVEFALGGNWSGKVEYDYIDLGARTYGLGDVPLPDVRVDPQVHTVKLGLNYRLWDTPPWIAGNSAIKPPSLPESTDWNVHGQTTLITQGYPSFRAPYQGPNSLPGAGRTRETWTAGAFLGWRLWV
ncbi:MAG TPA: cell envelope biogenesis protein OmpA, partial [Afipia sp.]|nr:cell envelope biogenesis protein OmpA [Afipia sp.]